MTSDTEHGRILVVDDERLVRRAISKRLTKAGHQCIEAGASADVIDLIKDGQSQLVILDIKMPGRSGTELLPEILASYPGTAVIMATAIVDPHVIVDCMRIGAQDYIIKPFDLEYMTQIVAKVLEKQKLEQDMQVFQESLQTQVENQKKEIQKLFLNSIESLVFALEAKDKYTAGHSRRVAEIAVAISKQMNLSGDELDNIRLGALLHDTGKIAIDHNIINKVGRLTEDEYQHVMAHASVGAGIVKPIVSQEILNIILYHHGYYNGEGFEQSLKGEDIPLGARILAVADCYDAMTSDRPYRVALSSEKGIEEITRCSGTQFDPDVVAAFNKVLLDKI